MEMRDSPGRGRTLALFGADECTDRGKRNACVLIGMLVWFVMLDMRV